MEKFMVMAEGAIVLRTNDAKAAFVMMNDCSEWKVEFFVDGTRCLYNIAGSNNFMIAPEVFGGEDSVNLNPVLKEG